MDAILPDEIDEADGDADNVDGATGRNMWLF